MAAERTPSSPPAGETAQLPAPDGPNWVRAGMRLARVGFEHPQRAAQLLAEPTTALWDPHANVPADDGAAAVVSALGRVASPDDALQNLALLLATGDGPEIRAELVVSAELRGRLLPLLGVSAPLAAHLVEHPGHWRLLVGDHDHAATVRRLAAAVGCDPDDPVTGSSGSGAALDRTEAEAALRVAYRGELAAIAARDLADTNDLERVTENLAELAGATVQTALAVAKKELPDTAVPCRFAVIAMGKTGGCELNYVSDVDVIFVGEPTEPDAEPTAALAAATKLAQTTMAVCRQVAWEVDANLRPEGKDGVLVRTVASHRAYYERWAKTWEFQALLKARPVAGDPELGQAYLDAITPLVWQAAERDDFVVDVRTMRRRVLAHIPPALADRELKLGSGGLRDVEFAVQLLQLVHGRGDPTLRVSATLPALRALRDGGYVGRDDALSLGDAYVFLRANEHRLQLRRLRRTHLLPDTDSGRAWLARAMAYRPDRRGDARSVWESELSLHRREVRRLHEKLFYRPLLETVAQVPAAGLRLSADEAGRRLAALGFAEPAGALRHIEALTAGVTRRATLQRALLPAILNELADSPDPDGGLLAYRQVSDELGSTSWYLRSLRDEGQVAIRLAYLLGTSRYVSHMLTRAPTALAMLGQDSELLVRDRDELTAVMAEVIRRTDVPSDAVRAIRGVRRTELLRIAFGDLLGKLDVDDVTAAVTALTDATVAAALRVALGVEAQALGAGSVPLRFAVIAMGRLGGEEVGYGSDADVMFVYEPVPDLPADVDTAKIANSVAARLRALLAEPSAVDPPLGIDADLRPEGRSGPLARSLASYAKYYARWSQPWEAQALLRARFCAGDAELGARFIELIDPVRYPETGLTSVEETEIRRIKARVDTERMPRGADVTTNAKLGRGGLSDIEWTAQLMQLGHGHEVDGLRTTRTWAALEAAARAGLISGEQASTLRTQWRAATHVRNAVMLATDKAGDALPHQGTALRMVGRILGYPPGFDHGKVLDDYRRTARRARRVVENVFYR